MEALCRFISKTIAEIKSDSPSGAVFTSLCWILVLLCLASLLWQAVSLLFHPQVLAEQMAEAAHGESFLPRLIGNVLGIAVIAAMLRMARK